MVQEPRDPKSMGKYKPAASAACWMSCNVVPAQAVSVPITGLMLVTPHIFSVDKTTPFTMGWAPPAKPVKPPWVTTGVR